MNATSSIPTKSYTIHLNGSDMGTIYANDLAAYMRDYYPGASFTLMPDGTTVIATATPSQLLEIEQHRIKAYVIHD